jgi:hypothetical protein
MAQNQPPSFKFLKHERIGYLKEMKQLANHLLEENKPADVWNNYYFYTSKGIPLKIGLNLTISRNSVTSYFYPNYLLVSCP